MDSQYQESVFVVVPSHCARMRAASRAILSRTFLVTTGEVRAGLSARGTP